MSKSMDTTICVLLFALLTAACSRSGAATPLPAPPPAQAAVAEPTTAPEPAAVPTLAGKSPARTAGQSAAPARRHLEALANDIGARLPGSKEEKEAAAYISDVFSQYGYQPIVQTFTFEDDEEEELESRNVIAVKEGQVAQEMIVGAHYDSVDDGDGADDNASGVAVLLAAAAQLQEAQPYYTIRFIAFGAEENDLDGSAYYVEHMSANQVKNTAAMINLDSLIAGDMAYVYGDTGRGSLYQWILDEAKVQGIALEGRPAEDLDEDDDTPCDCADYDAFQEEKIRFAYFEATNWNLSEDAMTQVDPRYGDEGEIRHTEFDTVEYLDKTFPGRIDQHLNDFTSLLSAALIHYGQASP